MGLVGVERVRSGNSLLFPLPNQKFIGIFKEEIIFLIYPKERFKILAA